LLAFEAEWLGGMAAITGAYLAGLCVAATPSREKVSQELQPIIDSFFGPLFFVSIGLVANARQLGGRPSFFVLLLLVAVLGKVVGCGLTSYLNGFNRREALAVGIGMIPRGEVGLITASLGWTAGLISQAVYVQVVVLVLATTLITPGLLKFAFGVGAMPEVLPATALAPELEEIPAAMAKAADA
jgi:Kef-type K+ transport system membrane component KefB